MSEFLASAAVRIVPDTTAFRAELQAELAAATRGLVVPVAVTAGGSGTVATAQREVTAASAASTVALEANAVAAAQNAAAQKVDAAAVARNAAAHEQLSRGAGATALSLLGVRGATLAASAPFLAGAAAITVAAKSVKQFTDEQEAAARVNKILGDELGAGSERWARRLATSFGLADDEALRFEGAIAEVLHNVQVLPAESQKLSQALVELAADSAAFNNVPTAEVLRAIQLGLSGNLRGLRQFIPGVSAAAVAQQALADTGKRSKAALTDQELVLARIEVIQQKAANQAGTFAERQQNLAAQSKILGAQITDLADELGGLLSPSLTAAAKAANQLLSPLRDLIGLAHRVPQGGLVKTILGDFTTFTISPLLGAQRVIDQIRGSTDQLGQSFGGIPGLAGPAGTAIQGLVGPLTAFGLAAEVAGERLNGLQQHLLDLEFKGASSAAKIADLQGQIAAAQEIIRHPGRGGTRAQAQARQARNQAQAQIKAIQDEDEADRQKVIAEQKAAVAKEKAAAEELARQKEAADQAFLDALALGRGEFDLGFAIAQGTKTLVDDIRLQKAYTEKLTEQIEAVKRSTLEEKLKAQALHDLRVERQNSINETKALEQQRREDAAARKKLVADRAAQRADLDIEIASTNKNIKAEIKARERKIALDREQLKSVHGDLVRAKQLKLDIAQQTQAIKDLKKEQDAKKNAAAELAFSFLQQQQGFAANLLSNLLPTNAIAGTVGGGAISTPSAPAPGPARPLAGAAAVSVAGAGGVTAGQGATTNDLLRQIVRLLARMNGERTHPEATRQLSKRSTDMAYGV